MHSTRLVPALAGALVAFASAPPTPAQNNVLILLADDLGVDNVGVYGEGPNPPPTPNLDALAARGVLFRSAWSNPVCSPTRACLQTGRYSFRTGVGTAIHYFGSPGQRVLSEAEVTLPEVLGAAGYAHATIGKWHLTDINSGGPIGPNLAGWSHFAGHMAEQIQSYFWWPRTVNGVTVFSGTYATTEQVDDALSWIRSVPEPWVCLLSFTAPHAPFHIPPGWLHTQTLSEGTASSLAMYRAMVEAMDTEIGRMFDELGTMMDRTNVVFLGDNGTPPEGTAPPWLAAHAKSSPYEGGINVPLIVAGPDVVAPGREVVALVGAVDVFGSVLELCRVDPHPPFVRTDSVSFVPYLVDPAAPPQRQTVFAELFRQSSVTTSGWMAIRNATHKLIRFLASVPPREELFDLIADPFEANNLLLAPLGPIDQQNYDELALELDAIRDTPGSFVDVGTPACAGSNGNPVTVGVGEPLAGASYGVQLDNGPPSGTAVMLFGSSKSRWGAIPLPFALTELGSGVDCNLYTSADAWVPVTLSATGSATVPVLVPSLGPIIGASIYHSWLIADPLAPANPLGITASNGIEAIVGS